MNMLNEDNPVMGNYPPEMIPGHGDVKKIDSSLVKESEEKPKSKGVRDSRVPKEPKSEIQALKEVFLDRFKRLEKKVEELEAKMRM